jgi:hypothetical protein
MFNVNLVSATTYQNVNVLVAYDEELAGTAGLVYGYSPEVFCHIIIDEVSDRFKVAFGIKFTIIRYVSWDSDDSITESTHDLLHDCIDKTGYYAGMIYNTIPIDMLIAFSDQPQGTWIGEYYYTFYGTYNETGAVIAIETYYYDLGQCTDNVLQHELSHLYGCEHHLNKVDCIMSEYQEYNIIYGGRPWLFWTENWCSGCRNIINENREMYGREQTVGAGHCPTLFVWNGGDYVDYGVIDIHNPTGEDVVREVPILKEDVGISNYKAVFRLREGWPGLNFSESVIDQVKLYAVDSYGNHHLCPLISAIHNRLGNVLLQLLASDDVRVQMLLLETIDLTFIVPYRNVQGFTFVIEGCNIYKVP